MTDISKLNHVLELEGRHRGRHFWWAALAITIVGAGLRFYHLDAASFWEDELNTVKDCAQPRSLAATKKSKLFGYVPTATGMWLWDVDMSSLSPDNTASWQSLGVTHTSARITSCLFGIVSIPLLGAASCSLIGRRPSIVFMLLLAVAPWHIYWSQAARFYTQQFLFYTLSIIWYFAATRTDSRRLIAAALVMMVLAFFTQPPALVICAVFALDWIVMRLFKEPVRLRLFGWAGAVVAIGICAAVLAWDMTADSAEWSEYGRPVNLYQTPFKTILGTVFMVHPALVLMSLLSTWWLLAVRRRLGVYLLLGAIVPPLTFALLSMKTYIGLRYGFISLYGWLALAAIGVDQLYRVLRPSLGRVLALAPLGILLTALMLMNHGYFTSGKGFHPRLDDAFAYVAQHRQPGEDVATNAPRAGMYYLRDPDVRRPPTSDQDLREITRPLWLVLEAENVVKGQIRRRAQELAEFKAYFDVRVVQPYSSVRVYRYDPQSHPRPLAFPTAPSQ